MTDKPHILHDIVAHKRIHYNLYAYYFLKIVLKIPINYKFKFNRCQSRRKFHIHVRRLF